MSVASAAREQTPPSADGLRTALRNVPLLPAPDNVDDFLARLGAEQVPFSSGQLAELVADARYVEPVPEIWPANEDDGFFAPVTRAANSNRRPPLVSRLGSALFKAGLAGAALLISWNALFRPDPAPPRTAAPALEAPAPAASEIPTDTGPRAALPAASVEPLETWADTVVLEPPELPAELILLPQATTSFASTVLSEPKLEPVPETPEPALELERPQGRGPLQVAEPTTLAAPPAPMPVPPAELVQSDVIAVPAQVAEPALPEPIQEIGEQGNESFASPAAEPPAALPIRDVEAAPAPASAAVEPPSPALETFEPVRAASIEPSPTPVPPQPADLVEPQPVAASAPVTTPASATQASERPTSVQAQETRTAMTVTVPPPVRPKAPERMPFAGTWAASPEACIPASQDEGHLLARIGPRGGRAGDTSCAFRAIRRKGNTWHIAAACSDGETSWRSGVRLSLSRGRLTWTSQKGSTTYMRCPRA